MRKSVLKTALAALLLLGGAMTATAQTVYGLAYHAAGMKLASVDVSTLNTDAATTLTESTTSFEGYDIKAATGAGTKYYAVLEKYDEDTDLTTVGFATVNFTTEELTVINGSIYGDDYNYPAGNSMSSLAYDTVNDALYGIEHTYDEKAGGTVTVLYKVNTATGELTQLGTYDSDQYMAVVAKDGKLYLAEATGTGFFNKGLSFYEVNVSDGTLGAEATNSIASVKGLMSSTPISLAYNGDALYLQALTSIYSLDLAQGEATLLGKTDTALKGITFTKSSESGEGGGGQPGGEEEEETSTRLLTCTTRYGDSMGYVDSDTDMKQTKYFYDSNNNLVRVVDIARGYTELQKAGDYTLSYLYKYLLDENGNLDTLETYQIGLYDFGDKALKLRSTVTGYTYDENGNITTEPTTNYTYKNEYDESGNLVKQTKVTVNSRTGKTNTIQVLEFSDFVAKNKPQKVVSTSPEHPTWTTYIYNATRTYNDDKNVIMEVRTRNDKEFYKIDYTYDGTFLTSETTTYLTDSTTTPSTKTEYSLPEADNLNKVKRVNYTYNTISNKWNVEPVSFIDEYADFSADMAQAVKISDLKANMASEGVNNVNVVFSAPEISLIQSVNFDIYRNGELIATKSLNDLWDGTTMDPETYMPILTYTDSALYNADYEYFVQPTVSAFNDELGGGALDLDEGEGEEEQTAVYTGYNISNIAPVELALNLPAVTNLKQGTPAKNSDGNTEVEISWTNPTYPEEYGFISNDLMFINMQAADAETTDPTTTSLSAVFGYSSCKVFILTRYKYGKALSDTLTVDPTIPTGIDNVVTTGDGAFQLNGRDLTVGGANVAVYSISGKLEAREANASTMNLSALKQGAYIVCIEKQGKTKAYKVILK